MEGRSKTGFEVERDAHGRLVLTGDDGMPHVGVVPVRSFPLAEPGECVSLVSADGRELAWIERMDALPEPQRALLEEELAVREFSPSIERIVSVSTYSTPSTWRVETDRGPASFVLKGEEDIRRIGGRALMITSGEGVAFRVRDRAALDRASRRMLERFL